MEEEKNDVGFDDFEAALFADDYQTDSDEPAEEAEEPTQEEAGEETGAETKEEVPVSDPEPEEDGSVEPDEEDPEEDPEKSEKGSEQTFTLKVNKEEKQVSLAEMTSLAQQGMDYGRVKEQYRQSQQTVQELQSKLDGMAGHQEALDILTLMAERIGTSSVEELAKTLYQNYRKSSGASQETADLEIENARLKKGQGSAAEKKTSNEQEDTAQTRMQREVAEFHREYPDIELSEELVGKLSPDIRNGLSMTSAYRKLERAQDQEKIQQLERQLAAERQNAKNKRKSPGSQKDSGGRRAADDATIFEKALFD